MRQRVIAAMLDGFGRDYWLRSDMPHLRRPAAADSAVPGRAVFPTSTSVNNIAIAIRDAASGSSEMVKEMILKERGFSPEAIHINRVSYSPKS